MSKFVKKANQWVVTIKTIRDRVKESFEQKWFNTKEEAKKFEESNK